VFTGSIQTAGNQAALLVGLSAIDMDDPNINKYFTSHVKKVTGAITDESNKQLRATLKQGINAGESIDELSARVVNVYGSAAGFRAERIARTESIHAGAFASDEAWRQSGEVEAKEWFTSKDDRVCEFCNEIDGARIDLGDHYFEKGDTMEVEGSNPLKFDYETIEHPPLHSNCRCIELPILS
jgi:SPP1 gp7 family putative phage head morphogenesis protein